MALPKQYIRYPLGFAGQDQKSDRKYTQPGKPFELANVRFRENGALSKRDGMIPAATATVDSDVILEKLIGGSRFLGVGRTPAGDRWWYNRRPPADDDTPGTATLAQVTTAASMFPNRSKPPVPRAWVDKMSPQTVIATESLNCADAAIGATQTIIVSKSVQLTIIDNATGQAIYTGPELTGVDPRVLAIPGTNAFLVGYSNGTSTLNVALVTTAGVLASVTMTKTAANGNWDWALFGSTLFVIRHTSAATTITPSNITVSATSLSAVTNGTAVNLTRNPVNVAVCVPHSSTEDAVVLVNDATDGIRGVTFNTSTLATVQALWTIYNLTTAKNVLVGARLASGSIYIYYELFNAADYQVQTFMFSGAVAASFGAPTEAATGMYICSKPIVTTASVTPWIVLGHLSKTGTGATYGLQHSRFLYEGKYVIGRFMTGCALRPPSVRSITVVPQIAAAPADADRNQVIEYLCADLYDFDGLVDQAGTTRGSGVALMRFNCHPSSGYQAVEDDGTLLVQGGFLALCDDSESMFENGFLLYPEILSITASAGAGSVPVNGSFQFVAVFLWYDGKGRIHRSAPSEVKAATTGAADNTLTVLIRNLGPTQKPVVGIEIYRTEDDGSEFYLAYVAINALQVNQAGSAYTGSFVVTGSDATLIASTPLGQQVGILENHQPSCPVGISTNGRRIQVIPGDDTLSVMSSKERREGEGATFFDGDAGQRRITKQGPIKAIASIGDRWVAMKQRRIYLASGEGPDDAGNSDSLSEFEAHPQAGIGIADPHSLVETSLGLVFRSERGFYLLDAGSALRPLGDGVAQYKNFPVVSAAYNADLGEVHFLLLDGPRLVLTLVDLNGQIDFRWSLDELDDDAEAYGDIAVVGGKLYAAAQERNDGSPYSLYVEDPGGYHDQAAAFPVVMRILTGWIPISQLLQGRGRLYRALFLGTVEGIHISRVRARYNYVDTWVDDKQVSSADATIDGSPYQWEFRPSKHKVMAVEFEFTEVLTAPSQGPVLNELVLECGAREGAARLRRAKRAA